MWWKLGIFVLMAGMIVASFAMPAPQAQIGQASRIFYYHIPQAWVSVLAFAASMIYSILYLRRRDIAYDDRAAEAARLGLVFCILATVTGSIFAKVTWGSFWNWDPRETSIFLLLLIYGAYFALRGALDGEGKRATLSAVYAIFAFFTVPFLVFVMPRVMPSLHPSDSVMTASVWVRVILYASLLAFTAVFVWLFRLGCRLRAVRRIMLVKEEM
jgi:heme exporter protein C